VKMIYDEAVFFDRPGGRKTLTVAELIVLGLDHLMPTRWRLASPEMHEREATLTWITRPILLQALQEAFEPLGLEAPIRAPSPPVPDKMLRALGMNPKHMRARFAMRGPDRLSSFNRLGAVFDGE